MNIVEKRIEDLQPYDNNPRKNDRAVEYVANSIKKFGWKVPIVIDKDGVIVAGHTRYLAAMQLGINSIPCVVADDLTEEQVKAFRIADNKTAEIATWDNELLRIELEDLIEEFDMTDFGFGEFELAILSQDYTPEPYDNEMAEEYSEKGDEMLAKKRVIITFTEAEEDSVKALLGVESISKVVYDISEIQK